MTKAMPFLRKYDITFLRPPPFRAAFAFFPKKRFILNLFLYAFSACARRDGLLDAPFCQSYVIRSGDPRGRPHKKAPRALQWVRGAINSLPAAASTALSGHIAVEL